MSGLTRHGWPSDFEWIEGRIGIRKTGVRLAVSRPLIAEIGRWLVYLAALLPVAVLARLRRPRAPAIWFAPDRPRPWYIVRGAGLWSGGRIAASPDKADAAFYFDDVTTGAPPVPPPGLPAFNFRCADISKSHVAAVFEEVFGYPLALDPRLTIGPLVEKPEKNGVHAGRIVQGPLEPAPDQVYQRLIDTTDDENRCRDLRTVCVGGAPALIWVKLKPPATRFSIDNLKAELREPEDVYSAEELALIGRFTARMGLDWGGLDVLRDRRDGRIYIVDVNKTDVGPVIALSLADKMRSMARLGRALDRMIATAMPHGADLASFPARPPGWTRCRSAPRPGNSSLKPVPQRSRMRGLTVVAVLAVAVGFAAPRAVATPGEAALEPAFGAAIVSTHPDGRRARLWLRRDHSYAAQSRRGERSGGSWKLSKAGKLCLTQKRPTPIPIPYCKALPAIEVGKAWRDRAFNGEPVVNEIVRGG